jgi:HlyD family secretion protein
MHRPPPIVRVVVLLVVVAVVGVAAWYYLGQQAQADERLTASGTIESDTVTLAAQVPGRVVEVDVNEGDAVTTGQPLVVLDGATLAAQHAQAQAQVDAGTANAAALEQQATAAQSNASAADAQVALLEAGPSAEQLAVSQSMVDKAQTAVDSLEQAYDDLSKAQKDLPQGVDLKIRLDLARADLETARDQQALVQAGARPEEIDAARAQADAARQQADALTQQVQAAQAQVAAAQATLAAVDSQIAQLTVVSPIDGVVLTRSIEPGEYAAPGGALIVVGRLDQLTITVYVPEDRYGVLSVGQNADVTVDSFPGETFTGTVTRIADQAEFTPRNVQTVEGRKSTVFAIDLAISNPDGKLKPGMPADVAF